MLPMELPRFILDRQGDIAMLCQRHHARRLDLFGSAARGDFEPERSDLDFLVSFDELPPVEAYDAYFSLKEGLEAVFHRPVDLVVERAVCNPYLRAQIESERQAITHLT
jgi:predicted nucleotidyltransferase